MSLVEIYKNHMLHCVWGPALHSPVASIATRILSSNAGERGPHMNDECGKSLLFPNIVIANLALSFLVMVWLESVSVKVRLLICQLQVSSLW